MLTAAQRRMLEVADRTGDEKVVAAIVDMLLLEHCDMSPLDIETALRDAAAHSYLVVVDDQVAIVIGMRAMLDALAEAGMTPEQNRAALGRMIART